MELSTFTRLALLGAALGVAASPAYAQDKPKADQAAPAQPEVGVAPKADGPGPMSMEPPAPPQPAWVKVCETNPEVKKEVCITARDVKTDTGQTVASVAIRQITGEPKKVFSVAVPPGMLIQPGVRVTVDQGTQANGKYQICFPNACYVDIEINDAFFKGMQKGTNLIVQAMNQQAKTLNFPVSLSGFGKAYEGPSLPPQDVAQNREKMNEGLVRTAKEKANALQVPSKPVAPTDGGPDVAPKAAVKGQ